LGQYTCLICTSIFKVNAYVYVHLFVDMHASNTCFSFAQVFFVVNTYTSNACTSCILAFFFLYKYFLSSVHVLLMHVFQGHLLLCASIFLSFVNMLLMHVFLVHLLLMQVLFIVYTHASGACIFGTFAFNASAFYRPYTCF
jgi:hypothetical protein